MPELREELLKREYVPVLMVGWVTRDIQINDTDLHSPLKVKYRELEQLLMIDQWKANPKKIPQSSRDDMMGFCQKVLKQLKLMLPNALHGSEDYLVSESMMLVGEKLRVFPKQLNKAESPKNLKDLLKLITPPKGVKGKGEKTVVPVD